MVEYEDELDLLAAVVTDGNEGEGRAHIQLYDNQSGQLLRNVDLSESWDEVRRHVNSGPVFVCELASVLASVSTFRLFHISSSLTKTP